jgi:hypothetical protein
MFVISNNFIGHHWLVQFVGGYSSASEALNSYFAKATADQAICTVDQILEEITGIITF